MPETKYLININWCPDFNYVQKWVIKTKEEYLSEYQIDEDAWLEMIEHNAVIELPFNVSNFIADFESELVTVKVENEKLRELLYDRIRWGIKLTREEFDAWLKQKLEEI